MKQILDKKDNVMSRRAAGIVLVSCAALIQAARYLTAAVFGSNTTNWSADFFQAMLEYVGNDLIVWTWVLLVVGVVYLVWAEVEVFYSRRLKQN